MAKHSGTREPLTVEDLYERYGSTMYHYAALALGHIAEVEDVMQEVLLKALRRRAKIEKARSPRAYLLAMVRNEARRHMVRDGDRTADFDCSFLEARPRHGVTDEDARQLERALGRLPLEQREVVLMKVYEGMSFREIGYVVGASTATAASRYRYALEKLRTLVDPGIGEGV